MLSFWLCSMQKADEAQFCMKGQLNTPAESRKKKKKKICNHIWSHHCDVISDITHTPTLTFNIS